MPDANLPAPPILQPADTTADLDRLLHNWQSRFTGGRSPSTVTLAFMDWAAHMANAPFKTASLGPVAVKQWQRLAQTMLGGPPAVTARPEDHRFSHPAWQVRPYSLITQSVLLGEEYWDQVVHSARGVSPPSRRMVAFTMRQFLDLISPSNIPWLNPEVIAATRESGGKNFVKGLANYLRDQQPPHSAFNVGKDLAATPGRVVYRNALMELIQYTPSTERVGAEPVLFVPAWIMKYYILDLSAHNSMVRWLVAQGHTVFMISWRNPGEELRNTSLDDYRQMGVMEAIDAVQGICGAEKIHAAGYCLGGTLLTIAAATMARDGDNRLASLSLFAAQSDFTEAGELQLFITEDQLSFLNDIMQTQGYLDSAQMGGAFQMLQSNDLVWSHAIRNYLLGERDAPFDLMSWDADGTRLPARMHIEYLGRLYLHNDLAEGRFCVHGEPLALNDLELPIFLVGTERDHIAPWHSVFKLHLLTSTELTFVLTSGGHNAGIVSEPGHAGRHFRLRTRLSGAHSPGPAEWQAGAAPRDGSWWVAWGEWLAARTGRRVPAREVPEGICDAPGTYVLEK